MRVHCNRVRILVKTFLETLAVNSLMIGNVFFFIFLFIETELLKYFICSINTTYNNKILY